MQPSLRVFALFFGVACFAAHASAENALFGIVDATSPSNACLSIAKPGLATGTSLSIVLFDPQRVAKGKISGPRKACGKLHEDGFYSYSIKFDPQPPEMPEVGIGVISEGPVVKKGKTVEFIEQPGQDPVAFRRCASSEGLHLTAWKGKNRLWHGYFYLAYDTEGNCTEEEAAD